MSLIHASRIWNSPAHDGAGWISRLAFVGCLGLAFALGTAIMLEWSLAMAGMGEIPMPGNWTMSMMWLPICGQSWPGLALSFLAMWLAMMAAMMLPSLSPVLWRRREALVAAGKRRPGHLIALIGVGYLSVWALVGCLVFLCSATFAVACAKLPELSRTVPLAAGLIVLLAGAWQFTPWKAHQLACWHGMPANRVERPAHAALLDGLRLGAHCSLNSVGLTTILLMTGMMDLRIMAAVTAAISFERLAPNGPLAARLIGGVIIAAALILIVKALCD
ncbi:copper chaperone [Labrys neptuniae]